MVEIRVKKGNKQAPCCRHFMSDWDSHNYCPSCTDKGKGDDVCEKEKPEDCYICLQFSSEQLKKLKARKIQRTAKENSNISKELKDSVLGTDSVSSETSASNIQSSSSSNSSSDPLQLILAKLESRQGRISSLERSSSTVKSTTNSAVSCNVEEQDGARDRFRSHHHTRTDEEELETGQDMKYRARSKRHRSPSTAVHQKDEEVEEDPTYRQFLATVRMVLDLPTLEDTVEAPSKIFSSRDRGKKRPLPLPMSLPPMEELNDRWKALEKKAAGNPQSQDSDKLQSTPFNTDSFLPYNRLYMKFYKTTTSEFALSAPKCQDSFKFIANKSASITPGSISVPSKQFMAMETVKREEVQILTFVSYFLCTLDKCASNIEEMLQGVHSSVSEEVAKEVEEMLSFLQIQFSCLNSLDKALETVIDSSIIMACNLELARRDTTL